jgi:3-dehydroquinate dehydratase-2
MGWLHEAADNATPVILNPAAFTHYSYALRDACQIVSEAGVPLIEVHLSNPHARESFRHTSVITGAALGVIAGFGEESYQLALSQILSRLERN